MFNMFNVSHKIEVIKSTVIAVVLVVACAILGIVWLSVALYNYLKVALGDIAGPALLGVLLFLPLAGYGIYKAVTKHDKRTKQERMFDEAFANTSVGSLSRMIETMAPHSPFLAALVAVMGGFLASRFPQFLSMFSELVVALGDELDRRRVRKAEEKVRKEEERSGATPPPPDVEPVSKRRRSKADVY